ncbi:hypothetical protein [Ideonella alba]|uniref:Uncharacterized protein n=1 Tax=Ideonella alba TaxID=2824118 RepID=A0A941BE36_9BURK|nr:hypothetical protein [Ideonella alba]MBQ0933660.1 hypothetical protein [Ideonella alba]
MKDNLGMQRHHSNFVRVLVVLICLLFGAMVTYKYFFLDPKGDISPGLLVLLAFFLVLVLSESFDNFSIGQLLSLGRQLEAKAEENKSLKVENAELRGHLVSVATSMTQHQTSTNIVGLPESLARAFAVQQAPEDEVQAKRTQEEAAPQPPEPAIARVDRRKLEEVTITKFLAANGWQQYSLLREAKLTSQFAITDPVSDEAPLFDGYVTVPDAEVFIEVRNSSLSAAFFRERLYMMLTKIYHYRAAKKSNVFLALVLVSIPGEERRESSIQRILRDFQPAISNGLLRVAEIAVPQEELPLAAPHGG